MKTAVNAPFDDYTLNVGSMTYGLAHLAMENEGYVEYLKESHKFTILDNAADELGEGMIGDDLWELVQRVQPDELILPDVLKETKATIEASLLFYDKYISNAAGYVPSSLMAVAQGKSYEEFRECFDTWEEASFVDVIGVPYDIDFEVPGEEVANFSGATKTNKRSCRRALLMNDLLPRTEKKIHLLGMNNLLEFYTYRGLPDKYLVKIRSNDTTGPFAAAIDGKTWTDNPSNLDFEKDWKALDFNHVWGPEKESALKNLMLYAAVLGDHGMSFNLGRREGLYGEL